jgi:hypothetical protein
MKKGMKEGKIQFVKWDATFEGFFASENLMTNVFGCQHL